VDVGRRCTAAFDDPTFDDATTDSLLVNEVVRFSAEYNIGNQDTSFTWDLKNGQVQKVTLTGANVTMTIANATYVGHFSLKILQDGTGNRTIDWDNCTPETKWSGGGANPTLSTAANSMDILAVRFDGSGNGAGAGPVGTERSPVL